MSSSFKLNNSHLPTIEAVLRRSKFDDTKSCHLGLSLHLPYKSIRESSHQNHPLLEFLTLWLESGRATVELLIFALKYIEEDVSADHIQKLFMNPACQLLLSYSDQLSRLLLSDELVNSLCTSGLILLETQEILRRGGKFLVGEPLMKVCDTISENHEKLRVLGDLLQCCDTYKLSLLGNTIQKDYDQQFSNNASEIPQYLVPENPQHPVEYKDNENKELIEFDGSSIYKYKKSSKQIRGIALIINNVNFDELQDRDSSDKDAEKLEKLFQGHRYHVLTCRNLIASDMIDELASVANNVHAGDHDSFVCCILSHGKQEGIQGTDGVAVSVDELAKHVDANNCGALNGMPKLFFFQVCRGDDIPGAVQVLKSQAKGKGTIVFDGDIVQALPPNADFLFSFSTSDGTPSTRDTVYGSRYIIELCDAINKNSKLSIDEILLIVHHKVAATSYKGIKYQQMPEIRSTLRGKFFFK